MVIYILRKLARRYSICIQNCNTNFIFRWSLIPQTSINGPGPLPLFLLLFWPLRMMLTSLYSQSTFRKTQWTNIGADLKTVWCRAHALNHWRFSVLLADCWASVAFGWPSWEDLTYFVDHPVLAADLHFSSALPSLPPDILSKPPSSLCDGFLLHCSSDPSPHFS